MKKTLAIVAIIALFCTTILWISAQNTEKPQQKAVGYVVTVAVEGLKNQTAFTALDNDLSKINGVAEVTTNFKTGLLTARIDESKITLGDLVNTIAKHPRSDDAEKTYGAKIVCYLNSKDEEKAEKFSDATKTAIITTIKKRANVTDITLNDSGKIAKISISAAAKTRTGDIGKWFGHGLLKMKMMVSLSGPVTSLVPSANTECSQCHYHR